MGGSGLVEAQLYALVEVSAAAAGAHRLEDVLELAAERALAAIGASSLSISRWQAGEVVTLINFGELGPGEERHPEDERYPLSLYPRSLAVLNGGGTLVSGVDDPASDPAHRELLRSLGKETSLTVPIVYEGETWGELWATSSADQARFAERDGVFLRAIADQIAAAIGRAELFAQVETLAYTDPLTGVANRRVLEEALERACATSPRPGSPALLLCDIDGLKAINDGYGHDAGDRIILRVADALSQAAADHCDAVVARMGGDEFCVLLPSGDADAARAVSEAAGRRLQAGDGVPITMACGIAAFGPGHDRPAALLSAADFAQYRAKRAGRDDNGNADARRSYRDLGGGSERLVDELLALLAALDESDAEELRRTLLRRLASEPRRALD